MNSLETEGEDVYRTLRCFEKASNSIATNMIAPIPEMKEPRELTLFHR